jgi:hypothetical protein
MRKEKPSGSDGYTFPFALVILSAIAFGASRMELATSYRLKRDGEEELLFRGRAYMQAIQAFYSADRIVQRKRYPRSLDELISDPRFQGRRYIRQRYKDPITGHDFQLLLNADGTIYGVASSSHDSPFRTTGFEAELSNFQNAKDYSEWRFDAKLAKPAAAPTPPNLTRSPVGAIAPQPATILQPSLKK